MFPEPTESRRNYARWQRSKPISVFMGKVTAVGETPDRIERR